MCSISFLSFFFFKNAHVCKLGNGFIASWSKIWRSNRPYNFGNFGEVAIKVLYPSLVVKPFLGIGMTFFNLWVACMIFLMSNCHSSEREGNRAWTSHVASTIFGDEHWQIVVSLHDVGDNLRYPVGDNVERRHRRLHKDHHDDQIEHLTITNWRFFSSLHMKPPRILCGHSK